MRPARTSSNPIDTDEMTADWDALLPPPRWPDHDPDLLRLVPRPRPYRIRLACSPIKFRRHSWAFRTLGLRPISPALVSSEKALDAAWDEGGFVPRIRFAAFVFDRDDGRLRIVEDGPDIFAPVGTHAHAERINPASPTKGRDWVVRVSWTAEEWKSVSVTPDASGRPTPLTAAELALLEDPRCSRDELVRRFPKASPDEIRGLWSSLPAATRSIRRTKACRS